MPARGKCVRVAVEDDAAADEHEPVDEPLDRAELVREEEDRHAELAVQLAEQPGERLLRVDVHAGGRLVQDEQLGLGRERLGDERPLLLAAGKALTTCDACAVRSTRAIASSTRAVAGARAAQKAAQRDASGVDELADGDRRRDPSRARWAR